MGAPLSGMQLTGGGVDPDDWRRPRPVDQDTLPAAPAPAPMPTPQPGPALNDGRQPPPGVVSKPPPISQGRPVPTPDSPPPAPSPPVPSPPAAAAPPPSAPAPAPAPTPPRPVLGTRPTPAPQAPRPPAPPRQPAPKPGGSAPASSAQMSVPGGFPKQGSAGPVDPGKEGMTGGAAPGFREPIKLRPGGTALSATEQRFNERAKRLGVNREQAERLAANRPNTELGRLWAEMQAGGGAQEPTMSTRPMPTGDAGGGSLANAPGLASTGFFNRPFVENGLAAGPGTYQGLMSLLGGGGGTLQSMPMPMNLPSSPMTAGPGGAMHMPRPGQTPAQMQMPGGMAGGMYAGTPFAQRAEALGIPIEQAIRLAQNRPDSVLGQMYSGLNA